MTEEQILAQFSKESIKLGVKYRAEEMLQIAANYIREHCPDGTIHYDETECDGYCVADDCETVDEEIKEHL